MPLLLRATLSPTVVTAPRFTAVLAALLFAASALADVTVGDTRDEAVHQHGFPKSSAKRGTHEYFVYANGGRIEFVNGKVADVKGPLPVVAPPSTPAPQPEAPAPATSPTTAAVAPTTAAAKSAPPPGTTPAPPSPAAPSYSPPPDANSAALAALSSHIEKMDTAWGETPHVPKQHGPLDSIPAFIVGLLLRFGLTIGALKLAFKFWEMDAFWKGILAIAGIDLALHAILELLGPVTAGLTAMPAVENGIPGIVLIFTIRYFCFNKRLQNAIRTASAVKLTVSLLYIFGGLAMLNLAFG